MFGTRSTDRNIYTESQLAVVEVLSQSHLILTLIRRCCLLSPLHHRAAGRRRFRGGVLVELHFLKVTLTSIFCVSCLYEPISLLSHYGRLCFATSIYPFFFFLKKPPPPKTPPPPPPPPRPT